MRVGKGINCLSDSADFMKVSPSLFVPPINIVICSRSFGIVRLGSI